MLELASCKLHVFSQTSMYNFQNRTQNSRLEDSFQSRTELIWYDRPDVEGPKLSDFKKFDLPADLVQPTQVICLLIYWFFQFYALSISDQVQVQWLFQFNGNL